MTAQPAALPPDPRLIQAQLDALMVHVGELVQADPDAHDLYAAVNAATVEAVRYVGARA